LPAVTRVADEDFFDRRHIPSDLEMQHASERRGTPMTGIAEGGAKSLLDQAADVLVQGLLGFALDGETPDTVALNAIREALRRAEVIGPETIDVAIGQHTDAG
jgi:hypothetical protein